MFPYKPPQMRKIFDAFAAMLDRRARQAGSARRDHGAARRYPLLSESSETLDPKTGTTSARRVIACSMTCSITPPISAIGRSGVRYRMRFARGFTPSFRASLADLGEVYREFTDFIVPYATGNVHPGFMGWVHGGGTAVGMLAEMLAAGLNANLGGRDHIPIEVERQVVEWTRAMFGFPSERAAFSSPARRWRI
jgi:aromatic-L-amino-acid decarboxylase